MELATSRNGRDRRGERGWRLLRSNPDYVADWRAHAGPVAHEAPPFPLRRQTVADLGAARWNLLTWEDPRTARHAELFWADVAMIEARAVDVESSGGEALSSVVWKSGATFTGLRLRDGGLFIKMARGRAAEQLRVVDGGAFDPARTGLEVAVRAGAPSRSAWVRVDTLDGLVFACRRAGIKRRR